MVAPSSAVEAEAGRPEFKVRLVYTGSSRPAWAGRKTYLKEEKKISKFNLIYIPTVINFICLDFLCEI